MRVSKEAAIRLLQGGEVVAIPTETVYGLAAHLSCESAIRKIFQLKGRPFSNPLILHVGYREECAQYASHLPSGFSDLTEAFWPGPLTLILPIKEELVPPIARAGLPTCAFRQPKHPIALEILKKVSPLVAPSANLSGIPSATRVEHVEQDFGSHFPVVDGGACEHGVESTILAQKEGMWQIARLGAITASDLSSVLGYTPELFASVMVTPLCPGQLFTHYSPKAHLILSTREYDKCAHRCPTVLGFTDKKYPGAQKCFFLGAQHDPDSVAYTLYETLRLLDEEKVQRVWVDFSMPTEGIWQTIRERLTRAAGCA